MNVVQDIPDDVSVKDAMERLLLLANIERGIEQADSGETVAHDEVKERIKTFRGVQRLSSRSRAPAG